MTFWSGWVAVRYCQNGSFPSTSSTAFPISPPSSTPSQSILLPSSINSNLRPVFCMLWSYQLFKEPCSKQTKNSQAGICPKTAIFWTLSQPTTTTNTKNYTRVISILSHLWLAYYMPTSRWIQVFIRSHSLICCTTLYFPFWLLISRKECFLLRILRNSIG